MKEYVYFRLMQDAMNVVYDVQREQRMKAECEELMVKGVTRCDKYERYKYFLSFMEEYPMIIRERVMTTLLRMGFGDASTNDLEPFLKIFREVRRGCCRCNKEDNEEEEEQTTTMMRACAREMGVVISRKTFVVLSEDVTTKEMWVELFDLAVRALHRYPHQNHAVDDFAILLEIWIRKSEHFKRSPQSSTMMTLRLSDLGSSFVLLKDYFTSNTQKRQPATMSSSKKALAFIEKWVEQMEHRW
jgi:hypothetical protein